MMRHGAEVNRDLLPIPAERLPRAQAEPRTRPAPAVELEHDLGEGLRGVLGRDSVLVDVAGDVPVAHPSCPVAGASRARADIVGLERTNGTEDIDLAVA